MGFLDFLGINQEPSEPLQEGQINVSQDEYEGLKEAAADAKMLKREMEDVGWMILNQGLGDNNYDLKPEDREKMFKRVLRYYLEDPLVLRSVEMQPTYVFGRGLPRPESNNAEVQRALDSFWDDPDNKLAMTTFQAQYDRAIELQLQANIYFVIFETEEGVKVGTLPHEEVTEIVSDPENRLRSVWFKREFYEKEYNFKTNQYEPKDKPTTLWYQHWKHDSPRGFRPPGKMIAKGRVFHVKTGSTGEMAFGVPQVSRILDWSKAHNEWMRARVAIAKAAANFAWERKVKGNPSQVMAMARNWATGNTAGVPGTDSPVSAPRYASMLTTNEGVEYEFKGGNSTGASDAASDQKMFRSQISAGTGLPQHFLGDEGSANLAVATAMNEPVIRMMEFFQELWEDVYRQIIDHHLEILGVGINKGLEVELHMPDPNADMPDAQMSFNEVDFGDGDLGIMDRYNADKITVRGGTIVDPMQAHADFANKPVYKLSFPPILSRDISSMMGMVIDAVTGLDPAGDNTELTRWAFKEILKTMGEVDPDKVMNEVFPTNNMADVAATVQGRNAMQEKPAPGVPNMETVGPAEMGLAPEMMPASFDSPMMPSPAIPTGGGPTPKPNGLGNSMDGAQNGARMGASLQESDPEGDAAKIWEELEDELLDLAGRDGGE